LPSDNQDTSCPRYSLALKGQYFHCPRQEKYHVLFDCRTKRDTLSKDSRLQPLAAGVGGGNQNRLLPPLQLSYREPFSIGGQEELRWSIVNTHPKHESVQIFYCKFPRSKITNQLFQVERHKADNSSRTDRPRRQKLLISIRPS